MIFKLAINRSSTIQSFLSHSLNPITVEQLQTIDTSQIHGDVSGILQPIGSFLDLLKKEKTKRFYIKRTFAAGDILMLVPVVRELRKKGYDPYLWTVKWARGILELFDIENKIIEHNPHPGQNEYGIVIDGIVEADHSRSELQVLHRCDIYFKALGIKKIPKKLDWSLDSAKLPNLKMNGDYICFQGAGSTKMKQLPTESINRIAHKFKEKGINVILISENNRMPIETLFALIAGAKCLVTMDSGPLWISHFTQTPTVGLFGPSRPSERLTYHPLWPKKAIGIRLNEHLNSPCESCFEQTRKCNGDMNCLKLGADQIFDLIYSGIKKWL